MSECLCWGKLKTLRSFIKAEWDWEFEKIRHQENPGCILKWLRCLFAFFYLLSFSKWISGTLKKRAEVETGNLRAYRYIDIYVITWFVIEIAVAFTICYLHYPVISDQLVLSLVCLGFFSYRLFDIFQSWVGQFILQYKWDAINANRSLVLSFVGYTEIAIIGTIVRLVFELPSPFYNSVVSMITNPQIADSSPIQYVQIVFSVLFLTAVAQQIIARISNQRR